MIMNIERKKMKLNLKAFIILLGRFHPKSVSE
jgi:hypothetical protein